MPTLFQGLLTFIDLLIGPISSISGNAKSKIGFAENETKEYKNVFLHFQGEKKRGLDFFGYFSFNNVDRIFSSSNLHQIEGEIFF